MEKVRTLDDLKITLQIRLGQVSKHTHNTLNSINLEADEKQKVLDLFQYTQYLERKAFEMRFFIDEYIRETNTTITSVVVENETKNPDVAQSTIRGSKMNDIEEDHPF